MDSENILSRFAAERQTLAVMDHPNIAKVFDAGLSEQGRPYFVMELVDGQPIHRYCQENGLDLRTRVDLMVTVCLAVHHAHQKGIIHRDIKPSNILVSTIDGRAVPKVIDFGIAKAQGLDGLDVNAFTRMGQFLGTPEYCSPEQAAAGERDVDTRSDVYSLGVVLYELITGELPFPRERLLEAGIAEIMRVLQEEEPPRPSTRISTLGSQQGRDFTAFGCDGRTLARRLRGELDWIVLKTLEKQRFRRYESAHGLAEDLERYMRGEAVLAGPPGARYRIGKFVRRHRIAVVASAVLLFTLLSFSIVTMLQSRRIAAERDRANTEAATAEQVAQFLTSLFSFSDPGEQRGRDVSARELLDRGADRIETELHDQPLVEAQLLVTMGQVYRRIHEEERAAHFLERALAIRDSMLGESDVKTVYARSSLAIVYWNLERYDEAEAMYLRCISDMDELIGHEHPNTLRMLANLANLYERTGRPERGLELYREIYEIRGRVLGAEDKDTLYAKYGVGANLRSLHRYEEAEPYIRESLERLRIVRGADHPNTLMIMAALGGLYVDLGRTEDAIPLLEEALAGQERVHGVDSPEARDTRANLDRLRSEE